MSASFAQQIGQLTAYTPIDIGIDKKSQQRQLCLAEMSNPHILVSGKSGSGKTYFIRKTVSEFVSRGLTVHILELHPDYAPEEFVKVVGEGILPHLHYMNYDYVDGDTSVNPLQFNPHPKSGGVYMAIQDMLDIVKLFNPSLGAKQCAYLQKILQETYLASGIDHEDQSTWLRADDSGRMGTSHHPTLYDVKNLLDDVIRYVMSGMGENIFKAIKKEKDRCGGLVRKLDIPDLEESVQKKIDEELDKNLNVLFGRLNEMAKREILGEEEAPFYSGWKLDTLESLRETIVSMIDSSLFTRGLDASGGIKLPKKGKINIYRLSNLNYQHQKTLLHILLSRFYNASMRMCKNLNPKAPDTYVVLDEGRYAVDAAKSPMSPLNVIFGGSRKFGLGMIVGVQGPDQLSKDMAENFSVKFILASSESAYPDAKKYFNLTPSVMKHIVPQRDGLFSVDHSPFAMLRLYAR